jgi:predicted small secreted protein
MISSGEITALIDLNEYEIKYAIAKHKNTFKASLPVRGSWIAFLFECQWATIVRRK